MFEFIRTHQRLMQIFLMLLIIPSFVMVGIGSYSSFGSDATTIAKVGDTKITQQEWEAAQRMQIERYRQMMGAQFDQKKFDTPQFKQSVFDSLIAEHAVALEAQHSHLTVSDASLQREISQIPGLVGADGKFDFERYKSLLAAQGMTPDMYDARRRKELSMEQLGGAIQGSAFASHTVAAHLSDIHDEQREIQELVLPLAEFVPQVKISDAMVKAFYDKNSKLFQVPEQAKVEYIVLDNAAVSDQVSVSDAEVAAYYGQNQQRYTVDEARRASHILIALKKDASAADKAAAKVKAEAVLAQVRKSPAEFAKIAKTQSQDPASAELGGDLDVITKGGAFPKSVEDAVYKLKLGEISDLVSSDFGFHILTLTSLKPATVKTLEEAKSDIAAELKKQKSGKKYSELAELFTNAVYENADSLKPAADKLKLKIESVDKLTRTPLPALGAAPFNNVKFLTAVFADDALKNKHNTEAVEVAPNTLIAGHVVQFSPASVRPLAEVDVVIRQRLIQEEALKLAQASGASKLAAFKASGSTTGFGDSKLVSRSTAQGINGLVLAAVMKADVSKLPSYVGLDVPGQGYGIYRINKVQQPAQPDLARRKSEQDEIANLISQQEFFAYVEALKLKAKVKILKPMATVASDAKSNADSN